jgi:lysophospholipase L1-like esterase
MRLQPKHAFSKTVLLSSTLLLSPLAIAQQAKWIATWTASPSLFDPDPAEPFANLNNQTVRERLRITLGGNQIRLRISNEYGTAPLQIGRVSVAAAQGTAGVVPDSLHAVRFSGHEEVTIPAGSVILSDPIDFAVQNSSELSVSLYLPKPVTSATGHGLALRRAAISSSGDHTQDAVIQGGKESDSSVFLSAVLVPAQPNQRVIVAFGDSTTDGDGSTPETDRNWPSDLFRRMELTHSGSQFAVVNEGLAGNRLLKDGPTASFGIAGVARFDRDALSLPGTAYIVLLEGINDIGFPGASFGDLHLAPATGGPTVDDITGAYKKLIVLAHAKGIRVIGATIMPCEGVPISGYYTEAKEQMRQSVNQWIRTSGAFDGVVDFDAVVRDPEHPTQLLPRFASGDHLHPNDTGYQAIAQAINLTLFR